MSKRDKFSGVGAGLGEALDKLEAEKRDEKVEVKTAPGKLMAFSQEMVGYKERIASLEAELANSQKTEVPVDLVDPNPWQPRTHFEPDEITTLAASIEELGLVQPIIVRRVQTLDTVRYQLVAGERRLRAHKLLGLKTIKAVLTITADAEMALMALAENLDRADLADYEVSKAIRRAEKEFPTRKRMAEALGMERSDLYRYLAFDGLPDFMKVDLDAKPTLLGRVAAEQVVSLLKTSGQMVLDALPRLWKQVQKGQADQGKLASAIQAAIAGKPARSDRDIKKLYINKQQAGSITRDGNGISVKIKAGALDDRQEAQLMAFVENLLGKNNDANG